MGKFYAGLDDELTLHVRYLAWLGAKPVADKQTLNGPEPQSRLEKLKADGFEAMLPPLSAPWVVEKLNEIGPVVSGGMAPVPLGWRDIAAWKEGTGFPLEPWEARLIRKLSAEYLSMLNDARKPECPAPWSAIEAVDRDAVAMKVRNEFRAMIAAQKRA